MKLCKDCASFGGVQTNGLALCNDPRNQRPDLVMGGIRRFDASWLRSAAATVKDACGPKGKWWKAK